tara:strand:+ start:85068 stop:85319 length:252 start_codon:yes stop_codon:yes gene_type:complete
MLERAAYYGLRTLILLYMTGEILKMDSTRALIVYGWFAGSILFSQIIGALLGDLIIGNKKTLIIGVGLFGYVLWNKKTTYSNK